MLIELLSGPPGSPSTWMESPHLRLSGGILSQCLPRNVIATLTPQGWVRQGRTYRAIRLLGKTRLLFGLPRDPGRLSREIRSFALEGPELWSDGQQLAQYSSDSDMWRTVGDRVWWHSVHLVSADLFTEESSWAPVWWDPRIPASTG
jgi:hypothetical protein